MTSSPQAVPETAGIKFPDFKSAGVTLRSQRVRATSIAGLGPWALCSLPAAAMGLEHQVGLYHVLQRKGDRGYVARLRSKRLCSCYIPLAGYFLS